MSQHRVRTHTRVGPDGKTHRVKSHTRALNTTRARRNWVKALREWRRNNKGKAAALVAVAVVEVGALGAVRGWALVLTSIGLMLVGAAVTLKQAAPDQPDRSRSAPAPRTVPGAGERERRRQQRLRSEQLEQQQRQDRQEADQLDEYHRMREARTVRTAGPAPGHPGGRVPLTRAEWEAAPDDYPDKAATLEFYRIREDEGYTGPLQMNSGEMPRKVAADEPMEWRRRYHSDDQD